MNVTSMAGVALYCQSVFTTEYKIIMKMSTAMGTLKKNNANTFHTDPEFLDILCLLLFVEYFTFEMSYC